MAGETRPDSARGARSALILASDQYQDVGLSELRAPAADAAALAAVLSDPEIGGFNVQTLMNEPAHVVNEAVEDFLSDRSPTTSCCCTSPVTGSRTRVAISTSR